MTARSYATASGTRAAGRPKAHTGRTTAKKTTTKRAAKTTPRKKATKTSKKKPGTKTKPKATARKVKKPLSKTALKRAESTKLKDLKAAALLNEPKALPASAWSVLFVESAVKGSPINGAPAKAAAQKFRNLTPEEKEVR